MNRRTFLIGAFLTAGTASVVKADDALAYRPLTNSERNGGGKSKNKPNNKRRKQRRD